MEFIVSVIIPVYNAEKYLREAIKSVLQTNTRCEILLVEDASKDNSLAIAKEIEFEYEHVKLYTHPNNENKGAACTRNLGIEKASHQFIAFLDADDRYLPNRFDIEKKLFQEKEDIDGIYHCTEAFFMSDKAENLYLKRFQSKYFTLRKRISPDELLPALLFGNYGQFHTNAITVKKSIFTKTGLFNSKLKLSQDVDMWCKMSAVGKLIPGSLDNPVANYRIHEENRIHVNEETVTYYKNVLNEELLKWSLFNRHLNYDTRNLFFIALQVFYKTKNNKSLPHYMLISKILKASLTVNTLHFVIRKMVQSIKKYYESTFNSSR